MSPELITAPAEPQWCDRGISLGVKKEQKQSDQLLYRMEDMGVERDPGHLSSNFNVYWPWSHLRPLFFWSWLLQINFLLIIIVLFIIFILIIVAEVLGSGTLEILDRFRENLVGDGNAQLQVIVLSAGKMMFELRRNPAYLHVVFCDLEEVEEASRLGKLIVIVQDSGVRLGQVVGVILPVDFDSLQNER